MAWSAVPAGNQYYLLGTTLREQGWIWRDIPANYLTRWNANGTRDITFNVSPIRAEPPNPGYHGAWSGGIQNYVYGMGVGEDDSLQVFGYFGTRADWYANSTNGSYKFAVSSTGIGDPTPPAVPENRGFVWSVSATANGKYLLTGNFPLGVPYTSVQWLNPDLSADPTFSDPILLTQNMSFQRIALLRDGKTLVSEPFSPTAGLKLHRLNLDGSVDAAFEGQVEFRLGAALLQPDGAILLGGTSTESSGPPLVRILENGSPDPSFASPSNLSGITCMALQADGKILIGSPVNPRVCRLNTDGSLDSTFTVLNGLDGFARQTRSISLLGDGRMLAAGSFRVDPVIGVQSCIMLQNDPAISVLEMADAATLRWRRGGSAPEVQRVNFDHRAIGTAVWTPLGEGGRIAGGWELRAPNGFPFEGEIRARGWNPGHQNAGGWVEARLAVGVPLNEWRMEHFGSMEPTGDGADLADPDADEFANLVEYLFGSNPEVPSASPLPDWTAAGSFLECRFPAVPGLSPLTIAAEWKLDPASPWETVPGQTEDSFHILKVPLNGHRRMFVRLKITVP